MTQELSVWVLLAGLVGLLWMFTYAILADDQAAAAPEVADDDTPTEQSDQQRSAIDPGRVAA